MRTPGQEAAAQLGVNTRVFVVNSLFPHAVLPRTTTRSARLPPGARRRYQAKRAAKQRHVDVAGCSALVPTGVERRPGQTRHFAALALRPGACCCICARRRCYVPPGAALHETTRLALGTQCARRARASASGQAHAHASRRRLRRAALAPSRSARVWSRPTATFSAAAACAAPAFRRRGAHS